jgi:DNA-binding response OmpR family regulator
VLAKLGPARTLPVLVFSAGASVIGKVMEAGADGFIAKPFKPEQLVAKIKEILSRSRVK